MLRDGVATVTARPSPAKWTGIAWAVCLLVIGSWTALLGGCRRADTQAAEGSRAQILHFGNGDEPAHLDPHANNASTTAVILGALFEGLLRVANDGATILPGVAERWTVSIDGLTYTFHLRDNARWSNGDRVTAEDFRASFLRLLDPQLGCEQASDAFPIAGARDFLEGRSSDPNSVGVRVLDERTLVTILRHPAPYWPAMIGRGPLWPIHMKSVDAHGGRSVRAGAWTQPGVMVSNGPFRLAEWRPNARISVTPNPHYWEAGRLRLKGIVFYPTDDENTEERAFRAGQLHVTYRLPVSKIAAYERDYPANFRAAPSLRTTYLSFNVKRAPFADARVRRALSLALNRRDLAAAAYGRSADPAYTMVRPGTGGYTPAQSVPEDASLARQLLAEAGFPGGAGLPKIQLTLPSNTGPVLRFGEAAQQRWAEVLGVRVDLVPVEFKVYLDLSRQRDFQVMLEGWGYSVPDPRDILQLGLTGDPNNDSQWSNAEYDAAFAAADATTDVAQRHAAFDRMEVLTARECHYAPVLYQNSVYALHADVRGWRPNPLRIIDWLELSLEPARP